MLLKQFYPNCLRTPVPDRRRADAHGSRRRPAARRGSASRSPPSTVCESSMSFSIPLRISLPATSSCAIASGRGSTWVRRAGRAPIRPPPRRRRRRSWLRLQALQTPGHTAESISLVVYDADRSATELQAVLTGDTLFVGRCRPSRSARGARWSANDLGGCWPIAPQQAADAS